ncbi:MAG: cupin domain-containing protein [Candidatus Brocadiia bacterium]
MSRPPVLLVRRDALRGDPALQPGARGARKLLVTALRPETEAEATESEWRPPAAHGRCPVQAMPRTELALFTHAAAQDRHVHLRGTEIYTVLEGEMGLEVAGREYRLAAGDLAVVNPGAAHQVRPQGAKFLCQVVCVDCGGPEDKHPAAHLAQPPRSDSHSTRSTNRKKSTDHR